MNQISKSLQNRKQRIYHDYLMQIPESAYFVSNLAFITLNCKQRLSIGEWRFEIKEISDKRFQSQSRELTDTSIMMSLRTERFVPSVSLPTTWQYLGQIYTDQWILCTKIHA